MNGKLLLFFAFLMIPFSNSPAQPTIAIMDFTGDGVSADEAAALTDRLRTELVETGKYKVVEREMMNVLLAEQGFQMTGACDSVGCIVAVGQILGAAQMVAGSVSKVGNVYSVSARVVDVETGEIIRTATYDHEGDIGGVLKTGMRDVAGKLANTDDERPPSKQKTSSQAESSLPEDMVYVEGGSFMMGSNDGADDEKPVHQVTLDGFYIGKYEVTQREYRWVMGENPSNFRDADLPVEVVSWYDAIEFCNQKSLKQGLTPCYRISGNDVTCNFDANGYRLPTESEWEYAARGGNLSRGYKCSGSDNVDDVAWYDANSGSQTHYVGRKKVNELGVYDMSGNVWEWCWDWYGGYSAGSATDLQGPDSGKYRVLRGGGFGVNVSLCRPSYRLSYNPGFRNRNNGFRLARSK